MAKYKIPQSAGRYGGVKEKGAVISGELDAAKLILHSCGCRVVIALGDKEFIARKLHLPVLHLSNSLPMVLQTVNVYNRDDQLTTLYECDNFNEAVAGTTYAALVGANRGVFHPPRNTPFNYHVFSNIVLENVQLRIKNYFEDRDQEAQVFYNVITEAYFNLGKLLGERYHIALNSVDGLTYNSRLIVEVI